MELGQVIKITITTPDGTVLDQFAACHWEIELPWTNPSDEDLQRKPKKEWRGIDVDGDVENFGSRASEALLMHRIRQAAGVR